MTEEFSISRAFRQALIYVDALETSNQRFQEINMTLVDEINEKEVARKKLSNDCAELKRRLRKYEQVRGY
jgi:hypothetical protein